MAALCFTLAGSAGPAGAPPAAPTASDEATCGPVLQLESLEDLYAEPRAHLGVIARVRFQLRGQRSEWQPYLTRFGPGDYLAFDAWSDAQMLWEKAEFDAPRTVLFVRRDSEVARALRGAPRYARFEATVRVEQLFLGRPWIELFEQSPLPEAVNEGALLHATRAVGFLAERRWDRAEDDLRRALASNLPEPARGDLEWRLEQIERQRQIEAEAAAQAPAARADDGKRRAR